MAPTPSPIEAAALSPVTWGWRLLHLGRYIAHRDSIQRLADGLPVLAEDRAFVAHAAAARGETDLDWDARAQALLANARLALARWEVEAGWRCAKAASRYLLRGLPPAELAPRAEVVLAEGSKVSGWRGQLIRRLLLGPGGRLRADLTVAQVVRAAEILHEDQDNQYYKMSITRRRLSFLATLAILVLIVWLALAPQLGGDSATVMAVPGAARLGRFVLTSSQVFWLSIMVTGVAGAVVSGFTATLRSTHRSSVPREIQTTSVTVSRLALGALSAVALTTFLVAGVLDIGEPSYGVVLALAFAAGFTEQLVLKAVKSYVDTEASPASAPAPGAPPAPPGGEAPPAGEGEEAGAG